MAGEAIDSDAVEFETANDILIDTQIVRIHVQNLGDNAVIEVLGKLHVDADFKPMFSIRDDSLPIFLNSMPIMQLKLRKNDAANAVKVWIL